MTTTTNPVTVTAGAVGPAGTYFAGNLGPDFCYTAATEAGRNVWTVYVISAAGRLVGNVREVVGDVRYLDAYLNREHRAMYRECSECGNRTGGGKWCSTACHKLDEPGAYY